MTTTETQPVAPKPKLRWYQPSKGAFVGLLLVSSCAALIGYSVHREVKRSKAIHAIMDLGGKFYWEDSVEKDPTYKVPVEIDLCDSQVSDAQLDDIIALISPNGTLILNNSKVTAEGVKKLQKALPQCSISWTPSAPPQSPPAADRPGGWWVYFSLAGRERRLPRAMPAQEKQRGQAFLPVLV